MTEITGNKSQKSHKDNAVVCLGDQDNEIHDPKINSPPATAART